MAKQQIVSIGAIISLLLPAVAAAEVTVQGQAQVELGIAKDATDRKDGLSGSGKHMDGNNMVDEGAGHVAVKASEELNEGILTFAVLEYQIDTADGDTNATCTTTEAGTTGNEHSHDCTVNGNGLAPREVNLGLQGRFGTLEFGRIKSPYKYTGGVRYDPFNATTLEARGNAGMSAGTFGHTGYLSDSLGYSSPSIGGLILWGTYNPQEQADARKCPQCATNGDSLNYAMSYGSKTWEVFYAGNNDSDDDQLGEKPYKATKIGGMVEAGNHKFKVQYERVDNKGTEDIYSFLGYEGRNASNLWVVQGGRFDAGKNDATGIDPGGVK